MENSLAAVLFRLVVNKLKHYIYIELTTTYLTLAEICR